MVNVPCICCQHGQGLYDLLSLSVQTPSKATCKNHCGRLYQHVLQVGQARTLFPVSHLQLHSGQAAAVTAATRRDAQGTQTLV